MIKIFVVFFMVIKQERETLRCLIIAKIINYKQVSYFLLKKTTFYLTYKQYIKLKQTRITGYYLLNERLV
jgi:hypothetical protein